MENAESGPSLVFDKDPFELTVEDVFDISYVVGRQLMKTSSSQRSCAISELQFKVLRVLEMFETLVTKYNPTVEELKLERDKLKTETERLIAELQNKVSDTEEEQSVGPDKLLIDLQDPNRPRFTLQELRDVLQERNHLKAQLLVTQEEIQCYGSGIIAREEPQVLEIDNESSASGGNGQTTLAGLDMKEFSFK
ncbi:RILP-like protein 2 isoform X2 [Heterodontus francisci]|uniref:RILP-like protein 2 isoform X2 n=1 Tax=Heterodontus francisci TaxID=7792 RepID=UPI00355ADFD5